MRNHFTNMFCVTRSKTNIRNYYELLLSAYQYEEARNVFVEFDLSPETVDRFS